MLIKTQMWLARNRRFVHKKRAQGYSTEGNMRLVHCSTSKLRSAMISFADKNDIAKRQTASKEVRSCSGVVRRHSTAEIQTPPLDVFALEMASGCQKEAS